MNKLTHDDCDKVGVYEDGRHFVTKRMGTWEFVGEGMTVEEALRNLELTIEEFGR